MSNAQQQSNENADTSNIGSSNDTGISSTPTEVKPDLTKIAETAANTAAGTTEAGASTEGLDSGTAAGAAAKTSLLSINWKKIGAKVGGFLLVCLGATAIASVFSMATAYPTMIALAAWLIVLWGGLTAMEDGMSLIAGKPFRGVVDRAFNKAVDFVTGGYKKLIGWLNAAGEVKDVPADAETAAV